MHEIELVRVPALRARLVATGDLGSRDRFLPTFDAAVEAYGEHAKYFRDLNFTQGERWW